MRTVRPTAELGEQVSTVVGGALAGVVLADVGEAVAACVPQRRVVRLAPRQHGVRAATLVTTRDQVGPVADDGDLGDAAAAQVDGGQGVARTRRAPAAMTRAERAAGSGRRGWRSAPRR